MPSKKSPLVALLPFWLFVFLFKFAAGLHYTLAIGALPIIAVWLFAMLFLHGKEDPQPIFSGGYSLKPIRNRHKR